MLALMTSILLLSQVEPSKAATPSRHMPDKYALLVGVGKYELVQEWTLNGPPNDVELWKGLLVGRFKFPGDDRHIRALSDLTGKDDPKMLPTRANIKREL